MSEWGMSAYPQQQMMGMPGAGRGAPLGGMYGGSNSGGFVVCMVPVGTYVPNQGQPAMPQMDGMAQMQPVWNESPEVPVMSQVDDSRSRGREQESMGGHGHQYSHGQMMQVPQNSMWGGQQQGFQTWDNRGVQQEQQRRQNFGNRSPGGWDVTAAAFVPAAHRKPDEVSLSQASFNFSADAKPFDMPSPEKPIVPLQIEKRNRLFNARVDKAALGEHRDDSDIVCSELQPGATGQPVQAAYEKEHKAAVAIVSAKCQSENAERASTISALSQETPTRPVQTSQKRVDTPVVTEQAETANLVKRSDPIEDQCTQQEICHAKGEHVEKEEGPSENNKLNQQSWGVSARAAAQSAVGGQQVPLRSVKNTGSHQASWGAQPQAQRGWGKGQSPQTQQQSQSQARHQQKGLGKGSNPIEQRQPQDRRRFVEERKKDEKKEEEPKFSTGEFPSLIALGAKPKKGAAKKGEALQPVPSDTEKQVPNESSDLQKTRIEGTAWAKSAEDRKVEAEKREAKLRVEKEEAEARIAEESKNLQSETEIQECKAIAKDENERVEATERMEAQGSEQGLLEEEQKAVTEHAEGVDELTEDMTQQKDVEHTELVDESVVDEEATEEVDDIREDPEHNDVANMECVDDSDVDEEGTEDLEDVEKESALEATAEDIVVQSSIGEEATDNENMNENPLEEVVVEGETRRSDDAASDEKVLVELEADQKHDSKAEDEVDEQDTKEDEDETEQEVEEDEFDVDVEEATHDEEEQVDEKSNEASVDACNFEADGHASCIAMLLSYRDVVDVVPEDFVYSTHDQASLKDEEPHKSEPTDRSIFGTTRTDDRRPGGRRDRRDRDRDRDRRDRGPARETEKLTLDSLGSKAENAYKRRDTTDANISRDVELKRCSQSLLNKICPENIEAIAKRIKSEAKVETIQELEIVIELIFKKALAEPHYCETYATMVTMLKGEMPSFPNPSGGKDVTFKSVLLNVCQSEFEKMPRTIETVAGEDADEEEIKYRIEKMKGRFLANMRFIGNLFLQKLLSSSIIAGIVSDLIGCGGAADADMIPEEHVVECVCELLGAIGHTLESMSTGKECVTQVCGRLMDLKSMKKKDGKGMLSKRIQFGIADLIDMRKAGWVKKTFKAVAKTKEEVRAQQEREEKDMKSGKNVTGADVVVAGARPSHLKSTDSAASQKDGSWQEINTKKRGSR